MKKLFSEIKKTCSTRSQKLAFNELVKSFAKPTVEPLEYLISVEESIEEEALEPDEIKKIKKTFKNLKDLVIVSIDNVNVRNDKTGELTTALLKEIESNGDGVYLPDNYESVAMPKDKLTKYFKITKE